MGIFVAEKVKGVGDKGLEDRAGNVQTLLEAFLNMFLRSVCFIDEVLLFTRKKFPVLGLLKCQIIRIS
jgi:hypothetical protein